MEIHGPGTVPLKVIALYKIPPGLSGLSGDIWATMSRAYNITRFTIPFDISVGEFCVSDCVEASKIGVSLTKSERRNRQMVATTTKLIIFIWIKIDNEYWKVRSKSFYRQLWLIFGYIDIIDHFPSNENHGDKISKVEEFSGRLE